MKFLRAMMMEVARTYETSVDNYFTRQYIPEDKSEHLLVVSHRQIHNGYLISFGFFLREVG
jgi:predicted anti-sigma-YlaC factor YlaD